MRIELKPENSGYILPSEPTIMEVTPEMASDWLSFRNHPKNRPTSPAVTAKYQGMMEKGQWRQATPEGLIFDTEGYIISGQHRLKAQANAGLTLRWWVFPDESRDIFEVVDQGYKRTAAHLLRVPYATSLASGARILVALADNDRHSIPRYNKIPTTETVEMFHKYPELTWYGKELFAAYMGSGVPVGPHAAVLAQASRTQYRDSIPAWLDKVAKGVDLGTNSPALKLRNKFSQTGVTVRRGVSGTLTTYALITKAWNSFAEGRDMPVLRFAYSDPIPEVVDYPRTLIGTDNTPQEG